MIELTQRLIDSGHAYAAGGDVYFSVPSLPGYGALSRQDTDEIMTRAVADGPKRDPRDFTLCKRPGHGEPGTSSWPTPWGRCRPGWHLECSTMSTRCLGAAFDIHGGGRDLLFPHHENEAAQSHAAGDAFARYWVHNAWLTVSGEKMSKSLDNSMTVEAVLTRWRPVGGTTSAPRTTGPHSSSRPPRWTMRAPPTSASSISSGGPAPCSVMALSRRTVPCPGPSSPRWTTTWPSPWRYE